jgi:DNA-binding response OmpR family regulator/tetratricopeptide (TPR) repeat protein
MRFAGRVSVAASLAAVLFAASAAPAQDAGKVKDLFDKGIAALEKGDYDGALTNFKALFQEDPNQSQILDLIRTTENKNFLKMLMKGGEYEQAAKYFLDRGHAALKARSRDREKIVPLVETAIKDADLDKRRGASRQIMAEHGAFAIPELVKYLGSNDTDERVRAIFVIEDIGVESVLPLAEVLNSPDAQVRQTTIIALRKLLDPRAYPILEFLAKSKDQPDSVRRAAENAIKSLNETMGTKGMNPEEAFLKLADMYYTKAPDVLRELGSQNTMWKWEEGQLKYSDCPAFMYHLRLAEKACKMALAVNPTSANAQSMLAIVFAGQQVSLAAAPKEWLDSDAGKAEIARLAMADAAIRSSGVGTLMGALGIAIKYNDAPVAAAIMRALPTYANVPMDANSTLVAAFSSNDQRIRWTAALTAVRLAPKSAFPRSEVVVQLLADAVGLSSVRQVLVVCDDTKAAAQMQTELAAAGMHAVVARTGADGLTRSKQLPFDAVVVASGLKDMMAQQVIHEIRRDFRTKQTPIILATAEANAEKERGLYADTIQGVVTMPLSANAYVPVVKDAVAKSPLDDRARALEMSEEACTVLAEASSSTVFDFSKTQAALVGTLATDKPESLKMKALGALKKWGGEASLKGLLDTVANTANAEGIRAESGRVAGFILSGKAPSQNAFEILMTGLMDPSIPVRTACAGALGSANLTPVQKQMVAEKARL